MADEPSSPQEVPVRPPDTTPTLPKPPEHNQKCQACGGTDHLRRTSKKCPKYHPRVSKKPVASTNTKTATPTVQQEPDNVSAATETDISNTNDIVTNSTVVEDSKQEEKEGNDSDKSCDSDISTPNFISLEEDKKNAYKPVIDVASKDFKPVDTQFKVFQKHIQGG